ncbi:arsenite-resistance protein, putative [Ixodes scapularis]|uniref:Serrate RNA effector molecule homolog n=1 Tax=Ixodes scapularis TaxID=6945 RepID=B7Q9N8_IXOSC|nr:arsenite-resistance protein, putative [Ixodes scapularis]|eukprot:XP_002412526.1 arsenite-resistance protein, putative [Ixodes scapularis]
MGDSDEEYDRRRGRDKFRRERSDYQERRDDRSRGRDDWPERDSWSARDARSRRDYRDYDVRSRRGERYSPPRHDMSPPVKRMRRDWEDRGVYGGFEGGGFPVGGHHPGAGGPWGGGPPQDMGGMVHMAAAQHAGGYAHNMAAGGPQREPEGGMTQPPMMTFKQFLGSQDDGIDDQEAVRKYNEYKMDFRRQQLNEFFVNHKEEEWFKSKYHPEEFGKRKTEQMNALQRRLGVFLKLHETGWIDAVSIDVEKSDRIVRLLDAVVILLEGGTEYDLQALDEPYQEEKPASDTLPSPDHSEGTREDESQAKKEDEDSKSGRKSRSRSYSSSDQSSSDSDSDDSRSEKEGKEEKAKKEEDRSEDGEGSSKAEDEEEARPDSTEAKEKAEGEEEEDKEAKADKKEGKGEEGEEKKGEDSKGRPRPLHRTCSIFLRNLAPTITKLEVEAMCKRYPGFLRVAIADPQAERRFFRRGWVTFERTVNIKEICWNLNNIRLRDCELGAIVNRDLSRRIRSVNGIASHKQVVRSDIKLAARIVHNLDEQRGLWSPGLVTQPWSFGVSSKNPLLKNITDYLIEEASAEEEELLGGPADREEGAEAEDSTATGGTNLEKDDALIKVLDRLLLYLRVVHSVDYYNQSEYASEDEMPNRCGIMHARGSPPSSKVTPQEVSDYINHFETKISSFLQPTTKLTDDEAGRLGRKDPEAEVEKFVAANTQELAKDKWLCPLSGKKFKGPEFVRKHIFNKHAEKVDEVRKEVEYFNNYLVDPKRPQLPEHPANRGGPPGGGRGGPDGHVMGGGAPFHGGGFHPPPPFGFGRGHGPGFPGSELRPKLPPTPPPRTLLGSSLTDIVAVGEDAQAMLFPCFPFSRSPRGEPRKLITYRDLDAPNDMDFP